MVSGDAITKEAEHLCPTDFSDGTGFEAKALLVFLNLIFGLPAVISWAAFGTLLKSAFSSPESAKNLNRVMGVSLFAVAIWITLSH